MGSLRIPFAVMGFTFAASALAQTPGLGETRPAPPQSVDKEAPAAKTAPAPEKTQPDAALGRCQLAQEGRARDDCLREERDAAAGASRRPEPPTAPPPQNPR
jgi:hypothetical protein